MPRGLRDAALTAAALLVLFGTLLAINPDLRQRVTRVASGNGDQWSEPGRVVTGVMGSTSSTMSSYAADNSYMVVFLLAGGLLFIVMLRT